MAITLIVIGLVICVGSFIFAGLNMAKSSGNFDDTFSRHIGAMIVMAIGGFMVMIGFLMIGVNLLENL